MSTARFLTILILFSALSVGFAQDRPAKLPTEPLEKEADAPVFIYRTESSPRMISQLGPAISYQVNVDVNGQNILGDAANEPSITMDPANPSKMAIGWRQFDSVNSNFRKGGWAYTTNGGSIWTFPGSLQSNFRSDPVLFSTDTGIFFYLSLVAGFQDDIWRSNNGGQFWIRLAPATGGDKQWFTIDNTNSPGRGFQYQSWSSLGNNYEGRQFTRSTDGGVTWLDPVNIPGAPSWGTLDVDSNGNLFIGGMNLSNGQFYCVRSSDAKNPAVIPSFDQITPLSLGGTMGLNEPINPVGLMGQAFLAIDRSGTSTNNNIYMLASVVPTAPTSRGDVMFAKSTDGGQTFSAPRRINDDPVNPNKWHWFGTFSVAPNGRIDVVWLDTRNASNNTDSQLYYSYSTDGGDNWAPNVAVSHPFNPFLGYPNQTKMGDYITIVSDNSGGNVAYCATFNEEQDIYYIRVAPGITPVPSPTPNPTPTPSPTPSATPPPSPPATPSPTPTPTPSPTPAAQAINLSTRMPVETGNNIGIGGFIITGSAPKHVLVRVLGPSLKQFGISDSLWDPVLELHGPGSFVTVTSDNWKDNPAQRAQIEATGLAPGNDQESAIDITLSPGAYTALTSGKDNTSGLSIIEVYDLGQAVPAKLANISTRALVGTGHNIVIAGFTLGGQNAAGRIAVRGIGPSLSATGLPNPLGDPALQIRNSNGDLIVANNNWQDDPAQAAELRAENLAPAEGPESALIRTLQPGAYTALLLGATGGTGVGLVEVYDLAR